MPHLPQRWGTGARARTVQRSRCDEPFVVLDVSAGLPCASAFAFAEPVPAASAAWLAPPWLAPLLASIPVSIPPPFGVATGVGWSPLCPWSSPACPGSSRTGRTMAAGSVGPPGPPPSNRRGRRRRTPSRARRRRGPLGAGSRTPSRRRSRPDPCRTFLVPPTRCTDHGGRSRRRRARRVQCDRRHATRRDPARRRSRATALSTRRTGRCRGVIRSRRPRRCFRAPRGRRWRRRAGRCGGAAPRHAARRRASSARP